MADDRYQAYKQILKKEIMMSLYDYLGRAAGPELGKQVATAAAQSNIKMQTRLVENPTYKGSVLLYPKPFLDKFFGGVSEGNGNTKQMLHG
jgi:hypothetical protein|tara:strand:+ start:966 stop:1238 length:273 start_codon:yes stop_codon:yes gene_type:complete